MLEDVFPEETYEEKLEADARERAAHLAYLLAPNRVRMDPQLRQMVGYMLLETDWMVDPISLMAIRPDNVVYARLSYGGGHRTPWQQFKYGPPPAPLHHVMPYVQLPHLMVKLKDACERAELDREDIDWLLTLPRVKDLRPEYPQPEEE